MNVNNKEMLNFRVSGDGPPVVFLHGFLESNTIWNGLLTEFINVKKICIELYGHGDSPDYKGDDLSIEKLANAVIAVLHNQNIKSYSIVGHSLGGYVALTMQKHEENPKCKAIVLLNSHPWKDTIRKKNERTQVAQLVVKNKSLFVKTAIPNLYTDSEKYNKEINALINEAMNISSTTIAQTTLAMRDRSDTSKQLIQFGKRALVIQGKYDQLIPYAEMQEFTKLHKIPLCLLENAGHMAYQESREEVVNAIKGLISYE